MSGSVPVTNHEWHMDISSSDNHIQLQVSFFKGKDWKSQKSLNVLIKQVDKNHESNSKGFSIKFDILFVLNPLVSLQI